MAVIPNLVPRVNNTGTIGTESKQWSAGYFAGRLKSRGQTVGLKYFVSDAATRYNMSGLSESTRPEDGDIVYQYSPPGLYLVTDQTHLGDSSGYYDIASTSGLSTKLDSVTGSGTSPTFVYSDITIMPSGSGLVFRCSSSGNDAFLITGSNVSFNSYLFLNYNTSGKVLVLDDYSQITTSNVTTGELHYLTGISGNVQSQLDILAQSLLVTPQGVDLSIQYSNSGSFCGNPYFKYSRSTGFGLSTYGEPRDIFDLHRPLYQFVGSGTVSVTGITGGSYTNATVGYYVIPYKTIGGINYYSPTIITGSQSFYTGSNNFQVSWGYNSLASGYRVSGVGGSSVIYETTGLSFIDSGISNSSGDALPLYYGPNLYLDYLSNLWLSGQMYINSARVLTTRDLTTINSNINAISGQANSQISQFIVKEVGNDWLRCKKWNGIVETGNDIYVAKSFELRKTPFDAQTISTPVEVILNGDLTSGDINLTYTYYSNNLRKVHNGTDEEYQIIVPVFKPDFSVIYAETCLESTNLSTPTGGYITWVDLNNSSRSWVSYEFPTGLWVSRDINGVARVQRSNNNYVSGLASIYLANLYTISGASRIGGGNSQDILGLSRILYNNIYTQNAIANIGTTTNYEYTISGQSRVNKSIIEGIAGIGRIYGGGYEYISGVSRILLNNIDNQSGLSRIKITNTDAVSGISRVYGGNYEYVSGISRILSSNINSQSGQSRIKITSAQIISGLASISEAASQGDFMPLDSAIYDSGTDKIYGVRGGHLYKFNNAGSLESTLRFTTGIAKAALDLGENCLAIHSDGYLYVGHHTLYRDASVYQNPYLIKVDTGTFTVSDTFNLHTDFADNDKYNAHAGPTKMFSVGSYLYMICSEQNGCTDMGMLKVNPNSSTSSSTLINGAATWGAMNVVFGTTTGLWYISNSTDKYAYCVNFTTGTAVEDFTLGSDWSNDWTGEYYAYGIAIVTGDNNYAFITTATDKIVKAGVVLGGPSNTGTISYITLDGSDTAINIKYDSRTDRVYVPLYINNRIAVINPSTDAVTYYTGFDSPWDIISTTGKVFAVQRGVTALKEIVL